MFEFDIEKIKEEIKGMTYEQKMDYICEKESDLAILMEEVQTALDELEDVEIDLATERLDTIKKGVEKELAENGIDLHFDENDNISFCLGEAEITSSLITLSSTLAITPRAGKSELKYVALIAEVLPDFELNNGTFLKDVEEEAYAKEFVSTIKTLLKAKSIFETI